MKIESLSKSELIKFCKSIGLETAKRLKKQLLADVKLYELEEIQIAIEENRINDLVKTKIEALANEYSDNLKIKINDRKKEMEEDDNSHYLIYQVLGISATEGKQIDVYQNTGRFLYKYAGAFLEEAASLCLYCNNLEGGKTTVKNNLGQRPKTFEIDFLDGNDAIEIKWRDATTDGDHITKEFTRVKSIESHGHNPIRVMFYYPQRKQAIKIQKTLKTIYDGIGGEYYAGDAAWDFIRNRTRFDLKGILEEIAQKKMAKDVGTK